MPVLKKITPALASELKQVRLAALKDAPGAFGSTYQEEVQLSDKDWLDRACAMTHDTAVGYLALEEGRACGLIRATLDDDPRPQVHIFSLWVVPEHRRAGVASQLLAAVQQWAEQRNAAKLILMVTSNNMAAIAFYSRHGFHATGRTEPYPNDPDLFEIEMRKALSTP